VKPFDTAVVLLLAFIGGGVLSISLSLAHIAHRLVP